MHAGPEFSGVEREVSYFACGFLAADSFWNDTAAEERETKLLTQVPGPIAEPPQRDELHLSGSFWVIVLVHVAEAGALILWLVMKKMEREPGHRRLRSTRLQRVVPQARPPRQDPVGLVGGQGRPGTDSGQAAAAERDGPIGSTPVARGGQRSGSKRPVDFAMVRQRALALPGVEEGTSYGTPAFKVRGKLFARLHQTEDALVVRIDRDERSMRMRADPETCYITDHYVDYPWMLVRLSSVNPDDLGELLEGAWRLSAPARLVARLDQR
jgi:hypothetical protein